MFIEQSCYRYQGRWRPPCLLPVRLRLLLVADHFLFDGDLLKGFHLLVGFSGLSGHRIRMIDLLANLLVQSKSLF